MPVLVRDDRVVVLPPGAQVPVVLRDTAADSWKALDGHTLEEAVVALTAAYGASHEDVRASLVTFIAELRALEALTPLST